MVSQEQMNEIKAELEPLIKAIAKCIVLKAVIPVVKDEVAKSENKIDDVVLAALLPAMEAAAIAAIDGFKM